MTFNFKKVQNKRNSFFSIIRGFGSLRSLFSLLFLLFGYFVHSQSTAKYKVIAVKKNAPNIISESNTVEIVKQTDIYVPSAFTPNNDGVNDFFIPKGDGIDEFEMLVFNRYGQIVFSSKSIDEGWDGTFNSLESPDGVYVYKIRIINKGKSDWIAKEGHVTLLR